MVKILKMINYYQSFINMRRLHKSLDELLSSKKKCKWSSKEQTVFNNIINVRDSNMLLTYYNPNLDIIVAADESERGIDIVIQHKFPDDSIKAIMHASRALTPAEQNYGQIKKEALALMYTVISIR